MTAAIMTLSLLILGIEIIAHAGFPSSVQSSESHGSQQQQDLVPLAPSPSHCGSSVEEAKQLGCLFDELSFAWQPPACYDGETIGEFLAAGSWEFFADEDSTEPVPHDQLALTAEPVHVTFRFHVAHCMFLRRQMVRLLRRGAAMDSHIGAYKHTVHCGKTMLNKAGRGNDRYTTAPILYPVCKPLQDWRS
ncbi:ENTH domain-containing protein [Purpureocillium lavendulum]|uniref:ENTH domain-containing protein n=1 Tax=Purpureocillium lavendulum TaxID=1247861 RepID=A0AB34FX71_9HYPO|nr:ENTH domain-containing protein [Purpureocillium lavendulum]